MAVLAGIGRVKVKVENSDQVLEVDEDDLEKANPSQLDRIEDLTQLRYINESSVLYLLRQRYGNNLIHTYSAGNLIIINPQCTLSIYNEKVRAVELYMAFRKQSEGNIFFSFLNMKASSVKLADNPFIDGSYNGM